MTVFASFLEVLLFVKFCSLKPRNRNHHNMSHIVWHGGNNSQLSAIPSCPREGGRSSIFAPLLHVKKQDTTRLIIMLLNPTFVGAKHSLTRCMSSL